MKTRKQLEEELEKLNFRLVSLSSIPSRRGMTMEESEELENLQIYVKDLKQVLNKKNKARNKKYVSASHTITLILAIGFLLLTIYSTTSAFHFMNTSFNVERLLTLGIVTSLAFILTVMSTYFYTKQMRLLWK